MMVIDGMSKQNKGGKKGLRTIAITIAATATATAQIDQNLAQLSSYAISMAMVSY